MKAITPTGRPALRRRFASRYHQTDPGEARKKYHEERHKSIESTAHIILLPKLIDGHDYEAIVQFLVSLDVPEHHVREGGVPLQSLQFIHNSTMQALPTSRRLIGLHIGNFVGVSLAYITSALVKRSSEAICISIDPNLAHRGIASPQTLALSLLTRCNLQNNSIVAAGCSGLKRISNDATIFSGYDPVKEFLNESACEHVVRNLGSILPGMVDLVFIDGNHEANYLKEELRNILPLLRPGAFVVLDNVDEAWEEIRQVCTHIDNYGLVPITHDDRVRIAQYKGLK